MKIAVGNEVRIGGIRAIVISISEFSLVAKAPGGMYINCSIGNAKKRIFKSVTLKPAAAAISQVQKSVTGCVVCGKEIPGRAKTCSAKCRKALSRQSRC